MQNGTFMVFVTLLGVAHAVDRFVIEDQMIKDLPLTKVLRNTVTGEYVQIITDLGGRVEDLVLRDLQHNKLRSVLLTHNNQ